MKILLIDDSAIIRRVLINALNEILPEVTIVEASDGDIGLRVLKEHSDVDIIFLDFNMPNMRGDVCLEHIRKIVEYNKIKIIMATTEAEKKTVLKMMRLGANGYLVKPFNPETIANSLRPIVAKMGIEI
jgi:two-component system, chemotaxis family, chemotaxis protein CheY